MSAYAYQALQVSGLADQRVMKVLPHVTLEFVSQGEPLGDDEGTSGDLFHVVSGVVCTSLGPVRSAIPLDIYGPGSWFCSGVPKISVACQVLSITEARLLRIPARLAEDAFNNDPAFAHFMARISMWRGQLLIEMLALTKAGKPWARLVIGLALLNKSFISSASHLPGKGTDISQVIPLKQSQLAAYFGLSRRLMSGGLQALSECGWVRLGYRSIELLKPNRWAALHQIHLRDAHGLYEKSMAELVRIMHELEAA